MKLKNKFEFYELDKKPKKLFIKILSRYLFQRNKAYYKIFKT